MWINFNNLVSLFTYLTGFLGCLTYTWHLHFTLAFISNFWIRSKFIIHLIFFKLTCPNPLLYTNHWRDYHLQLKKEKKRKENSYLTNMELLSHWRARNFRSLTFFYENNLLPYGLSFYKPNMELVQTFFWYLNL